MCASEVQGQDEQRIFISYDASNGLADNSAQILLSTQAGRIMASTLGHINFFDGSGFIHIDPQASDTHPLPGYDGRYRMAFDRHGRLWLKHDRMMSCLNLMTERFVNDIPAALSDLGVKGTIDDFYGEGEDEIWFRQGRQLFAPSCGRTFPLHDVSDLQDVSLYGGSLLLMFHADGSVVVSDYHTGKMIRQDHAFPVEERQRYSLSSEVCLVGDDYYQIRNGNEGSVLLSYDVEKHQWQRLMEQPFHLTALCSRDYKLYIGSQQGYLVYDMLTGAVQHIETLQLSKGRKQRPRILDLTFDRQGGMWIGTERRGLLYSKAFAAPFRQYAVNSPEGEHYQRLLDHRLAAAKQQFHRYTTFVFTDSRGWRWTGTFSGLKLQKPDSSEVTLTTDNGLPNNVIHCIVEDHGHDIWVGTSYGIAHLFIRDDGVYHIEPYINQDNVPNEMFLNNRALVMEDNTVIMQGIDHFVVFNPNHFHARQFGEFDMVPKLVSLSVNGNSITAGAKVDGEVITDLAVSHTWHFNVNYNQNTLLLHFTGLNYLRPIQTYYRVRVQGVAGFDDWRILSFARSDGMVDKFGQLRLPLIGLEPGDYKVEVQASMWPETWPVSPYVWEIHVAQPWWRTTAVVLILGVLLVVLLVFNFLYYNRNVHKRLENQNEEYDILRNLRSIAARCLSLENEVLHANSVCELGGNVSEEEQDRFDRAMLYIIPYIQRSGGQPLQLEQVIASAGLKPVEFYAMLSSQVEKSPVHLLLPLRLQKAAQMLQLSNSSVDDIARHCAFETTGFFIEAFTKFYHLSPADYRNAMAR